MGPPHFVDVVALSRALAVVAGELLHYAMHTSQCRCNSACAFTAVHAGYVYVAVD